MRFRVFGVRLAFLVGLACLLLLLQMLAVSRLSSSQATLPWRERDAGPDDGTSQSPPLEHEKPPVNHNGDKDLDIAGRSRHTTKPSLATLTLARGTHDRVVRHMQQLDNISQSEEKATRQQEGEKKEEERGEKQEENGGEKRESVTVAATHMSVTSTKPAVSFRPMALPSQHKDCDLKGKKDAQSAISRAHSQECKGLIRNVTCLQKAQLLYDPTIRRECGSAKPGRGFQHKPLSEGTGPLGRAAFLLSLHGRAFRQVKRLMKAVYHSDHYYYVHVDSRSDYLHHKLYEAFSDYPNVYFPNWRMATIWGGASLLQMLLKALEDLEYVLTDWKWDYFINLSESDFPVKTNDELMEFLRAHRGSNFVKTHGGDIKKFIQKQGLDRTFVQCDNHMWRVDNRKLPPDLVIDGGSDWVALHRNYTRYLVTDTSTFLTGLKRYYEYSLLPAESFFHTVLRNGPLCDTFIKTNLRVTNWNRKLGCRCQYKHVVDWCGCSPNDFLSKDIGKLKAPGNHHFFARKFEAIVNQDVIHKLESHLFGYYPHDTAALDSYWESLFHIEDDLSYPYNARYTTYQSFLRLGLSRIYTETKRAGEGEGEAGRCQIPKQAVVKEVTVLAVRDEFRGLVVTLRDALSERLSAPEFEVLFSPYNFLAKYTVETEVVKRIEGFEVGTEWDGKESTFRNFARIIGVWDEPVAAIRLSKGKMGEVVIVWDDPIGKRISTHTTKLEASWFVTYHKPKLDRPIRPGFWNCRIELTDGTAVMETRFLVMPLTHEHMRIMDDPASVNAKWADEPHPMESVELTTWKENVRKTGQGLERWVDDLTEEGWKMEELCRTIPAEGCTAIVDCSSTEWSTFSPDPKSELKDVQDNGRIR